MTEGYPRQFAQLTPEKPAVVLHPGGNSLGFAELEARANQFAQFLRASGLRQGDRVAFRLENCLEVFPFVWGAQRAGMLYVSISNKFTYDELEFILHDSGAKLLLSSAQGEGTVLKKVAENFSESIQLLGTGVLPDGWRSWSEALAGCSEEPIADEYHGVDMMYSSGTTGRPKGIVSAIDPAKPVDEAPVLATLASQLFGMDSDAVYLSPAPLYHAAPLRWCMATQYLGGTVIVQERFDPEQTLAAIETHSVTHAQFVPTHFNRLLDLPEEARQRYDVSSLESVVHAAAPCSIETKQQIIDWFGPLVDEYYAGSEGSGMTFCSCADWLEHKGSVGRAVVGTLRICDDEGDPLPVGEEGGIYFENGLPFSYHQDEVKTAESTNKHGWTTIGDVGRLDEDGFLYLTDRKSFMIISGGVNIYPQEIENLLINQPLVRDIAIIGTPDKDFGETVTAVVELYDPSLATDETRDILSKFCREKLSSVKVPKRFDFTGALPRTETGKLLKRKVREAYWAGEKV